MSSSASLPIKPIAAAERVGELDVLRGVALFGVFLANFWGLARDGVMATADQLAALPTNALDPAFRFAEAWLVADKANTLFAFLFGLGFALQMDRLEARGADFVRLYSRRLAILLLIGLAHLAFVFTFDILHLYAIAGFLLLALRRVGDRLLLLGGIVLALCGRIVQEEAMLLLHIVPPEGWASPSSTASVLARQALSLQGDYWGLVRAFFDTTYVDYIANGLVLGWLAYALGRFMLGAWVGRRGWLQNARDYLPGFRKTLVWALPTGLVLEAAPLVAPHLWPALRTAPGWELAAISIHLVSTPVLAAGYACAVVVALQTGLGRRLLSCFGDAGRMALTNYVGQSLVYGLFLFGVGPGLALAGHIGMTQVTLIVVAAFAVQIAISRLWLAHFRYGPLEWVWRALTYGERPPIRRAPSGALQTRSVA